MPDEVQVAKARKLKKLLSTPRFEQDQVYALVVATRYNALSEEAKDIVDQEVAADPETLSDAPARRSRRLDIEVEYQRRLQENPDEKPPLVVKVLIAGSGYNGWATQVESSTGKVLNWERADDGAKPDEVLRHKREQGKGAELMFAGPGGSETKGGGAPYKGTRDIGSNSIAALVEQVPPLVRQAIDPEIAKEGNKDRLVVILIKAHSRGAVAASRIATILRSAYPRATVELAQVDPVPGPGHAGEDLAIDLGQREDFGGLDETTVVYSVASGYSAGFTPQKVDGTKRIIVSRQGHSVGLEKGFIYEGELYKGSSLNSLSPGVYVDMNTNGENVVPLTRVAGIAEAKAEIAKAYKASSAWTGDSGRMEIITEVLTGFLGRA